MKPNRFRVRVSLVFLLVCVAAGLVTLRLAGQLPVGQVVVIHTFTGGADGANPATGLIQMPNGNFAGMTKGQGSQSAQPPTVYTMTPDCNVTTLYTFAKDGSQGWCREVQGDNGGAAWGTDRGAAFSDFSDRPVFPRRSLLVSHRYLWPDALLLALRQE